MKNLFTHQILPDEDESYVPYENPYLVSRVSPEVEAMMQYDDDERVSVTEALEAQFPTLSFEVIMGGQEVYSYLIAVE